MNKAQALRVVFSPGPLFPLDAEDLAQLPREFHDLPGAMPTTFAEFHALTKDAE